MFSFYQFLLIMWYVLGTITVIFVVGWTLFPIAMGQTPTVTVPNPQSGLNFLPQKAYVTTLTPEGIPIQLQPVQQQQSTDALGQIGPYITALVSALGVKILGDKKVAKVSDVVLDNQAEIVKGKQVDKELARVTYNMNPVEAAKITDAPLVKNETLAADAADSAQKAAKTSLPT